MERDQRGGHCYVLMRDSSISLVYKSWEKG